MGESLKDKILKTLEVLDTKEQEEVYDFARYLKQKQAKEKRKVQFLKALDEGEQIGKQIGITEEEILQEVKEYRREKEEKKLRFSLRGGLKEYRDKYTSVELQKKVLEWIN